MYSKKYTLDKVEEFGRHNPLYDGVEGSLCYPAYLHVGERGWFLYERINASYSTPHRVHTSIVKDVEYLDNQIILTTENTRFTFNVVREGKDE